MRGLVEEEREAIRVVEEEEGWGSEGVGRDDVEEEDAPGPAARA